MRTYSLSIIMSSSKSIIDPLIKILSHPSFAPVHISTFKDKLLLVLEVRIQYCYEEVLIAFGAIIPLYRSRSFKNLYS